MDRSVSFNFLSFLLLLAVSSILPSTLQAQSNELGNLQSEHARQVRPLLKKYCFECHADKTTEAEIGFDKTSISDLVSPIDEIWIKTQHAIQTQQMPPKESKQPSDAERKQIDNWLDSYLTLKAKASAGDPGPVVLRRLNNAEYSYTIRDITAVESLTPARELPIDSASGEGFTNTGNSLVMSPALFSKYLKASKEIASHAVLTSNGFRFSKYSTESDWTNETLHSIRDLYSRYSDASGGDKVNLQGIIFDTNQGGRLPLEKYLQATIDEKSNLLEAKKSIVQVATERGISSRYLQTVWSLLSQSPIQQDSQTTTRFSLHKTLQQKWADAAKEPSVVKTAALNDYFFSIQKSLIRFATVGHIGKLNGPKSWQEPVNPIVSSQEIRYKIPTESDQTDIQIDIRLGTAGDESEQDVAILENPRFTFPGKPDLRLRDVAVFLQNWNLHKRHLFTQTESCLLAIDELQRTDSYDIESISKKYGIDPALLQRWLAFLQISNRNDNTKIKLLDRTTQGIDSAKDVKGWIGDDALSLLANSSDQLLRIPGSIAAHSVAVHPAPTVSVGVAWQSPIDGPISIQSSVQDVHSDCGNGVSWTVERSSGNFSRLLGQSSTNGSELSTLGPLNDIVVRKGDVVRLMVHPKDQSHDCDATAIELKIHSNDLVWSLSKDVSRNVLESNPHSDSYGNKSVWSFLYEKDGEAEFKQRPTVTPHSLLERWLVSSDSNQRIILSTQLQRLLIDGVSKLPTDSPDRILYDQLNSFDSPFFDLQSSTESESKTAIQPTSDIEYGLPPDLFGKDLKGNPIPEQNLSIAAPQILTLKLPLKLFAGLELVTVAKPFDNKSDAAFQISIGASFPGSTQTTDVAVLQEWNPALPIIASESIELRSRFTPSFDFFRQHFPLALCYSKIVPVDEVVTLTLFYREDEPLQRLMLSQEEQTELNQLWSDLRFISREPYKLVDAYEQLWQYATQDADPKAFEPLQEPIQKDAKLYDQQREEAQAYHLKSALTFAERAFRRPLSPKEVHSFDRFYRELRTTELNHEDAIRLLISRILTAPQFLYRLEKSPAGSNATKISPFELVNRLSYFLWSSCPDKELLRTAADGTILDNAVLISQTQRLLRDSKCRRLATEFPCQWLQIADFDQHDEKSETKFPEFHNLRSEMHEEAIRFFTDFFQSNRPCINLINADYAFVNEKLAKHYSIPNVQGESWQRIEQANKYFRGGILTFASILSKQAGASRTSPILRGNWLSEVILGERLPRPPKNVPQLAEAAPEGITERQLIEMHSSNEACAKCHARIDPFGFALENYDAIGRFRAADEKALPIDSFTKLPDGSAIEGISGLRTYLLTHRQADFLKQFNRKLLGYALGRSIQLSDTPLLNEILRRQISGDDQIQSVIISIVTSKQFQEIRGQDFAANAE